MSSILYVDGAFPQRTPASLDKLREYNPAGVIAGSGFGPDAIAWLRRTLPDVRIFHNFNPLSIKPWRTLGHPPSRRVWDLDSHKSYVTTRYHDWLHRQPPAFSGLRDEGRPKEFLAPLWDAEYVDWLLRSIKELHLEYRLHIWHEWPLLTRVPSWYPISNEDWTDAHTNGVLRYMRGLSILSCNVGSNIITRSMVEEDGVAAGDWLDVVKIEWNAQVPHDYADASVDMAQRGPRWWSDRGKAVVLEVWDDGTTMQADRWRRAKNIAHEVRNKGGACHLVRYKKAADGDWPDHRSWPEVE